MVDTAVAGQMTRQSKAGASHLINLLSATGIGFLVESKFTQQDLSLPGEYVLLLTVSYSTQKKCV